MSRPDSPQELEYPPIRINQSLAQLDLNALIMRSNPHRPTEEANSLDESSYEVVGMSDSICSVSDDDGHTASVASTSPDDISVETLSGTDDDDDDDFEHHYVDEASQAIEPSVADPLDAHVIAAGQDSVLTERPSLCDSESGYHFKMHEQSAVVSDFLEGSSIVKEFTPEQSSSKVLEAYGCSDIRLTVRAGLAERFYPDCESFRVLFVGRMDTWNEERIKSSLLNALIASPGSSKSVMVRGQMEPYSPVLHTDHCTSIEVLPEPSKDARVVITLDDSEGAELAFGTSGKQHTVGSASFPDLVIFCYPQTSGAALGESDLLAARDAFQRHGIPYLDITDHRRFHEDHVGFRYNSRSLRVCVEGRTNVESQFVERDVLPMDVFNFMQLESSDLNRHLVAISPRLQSLRLSNHSEHADPWRINDFIPTYVARVWKFAPAVDRLQLTLLALCGIVALSYLTAGLQPLQAALSRVVPPEPAGLCSSAPAAIISAAQASTSATPSTTADNLLHAIVAKHSGFGQNVDKSLKGADSLRRKVVQHLEQTKQVEQPKKKSDGKEAKEYRKSQKKAGKTGVFEIQTSGEQQFILRPPKELIGRARKPQLQIQVSRDAQTVPIRYERTMDGVYIVDLAKEYPAGSFNVSIATHSKPLMQQSFNISLGREKPRVARLVDSIKAHHNIRDISSSIVQQVQSISTRLTDGTHSWKDKASLARHDWVDRLQGARKEAHRQLAAGSDAVRVARSRAWTSFRRATAPVRTSERLIVARNNAYIARCGFERAVGLSSKDRNGKKTRSCEAAKW